MIDMGNDRYISNIFSLLLPICLSEFFSRILKQSGFFFDSQSNLAVYHRKPARATAESYLLRCSTDPAENCASFVHHYFGGALPLREKQRGSRSVKNKGALDIHPVRCYYP